MTTSMNRLSALAIAAVTLTTATLLVGGDASAGPVRGLPNQPANPPGHSGISGVGVRPVVGALPTGGISGVGVRPVVGALPTGGISGVGVRPVVGALPTGGSNPPGRIVDPCFTCINHDHDHDRDYDHDHDHRHWGHRGDFSYPAVIEMEEARPDYCVYEYKWRTRYVPGFGLERVLVKVCGDI
jgi:hypothetical protein